MFKSPEQFFEDGQIYYSQENYSAALDAFMQASQTLSENPELFAWIARTYNSLEQYEKALDAANRAILLDASCGVAFRQRAYVYEQQDRYLDAIREYSEAIQLSPSDAIAHFRRGSVYDALEDDPNAIADYSRATELDPTDPAPLYWRGMIFASQGNYSKAIEDFSQSLRLDPTQSDGYLARGTCQYDEGRTTAAIEDFTSAIRADTQNAEAYKRRGHAQLDQDKVSQAIEDYSTAIQLDPTDSRALMGRALAYSIQNQYGKSLEDVSKAIQLDPQYEQAHMFLGDIYMEQGNFAGAIHEYSEVKRINPANSEFAEALDIAQKAARGELKLWHRPSKESLDLFQRAAEIIESGGEVLSDSDKRQVVSLLNGAVRKAGGPFPRAQSVLALFYFDLGDKRLAKKHASQALQADPTEFRAQLVKTFVSGDNILILNVHARGLVPRGIGALYLFEVIGKLLKGIFDFVRATYSLTQFKGELIKLLLIYEQVTSSQLPATEFLYLSHHLVSLADSLEESGISLLGGTPNLYAGISRVQSDRIVFDAASISEKSEVEKLFLLARSKT